MHFGLPKLGRDTDFTATIATCNTGMNKANWLSALCWSARILLVAMPRRIDLQPDIH